jgi:hypothetical protein
VVNAPQSLGCNYLSKFGFTPYKNLAFDFLDDNPIIIYDIILYLFDLNLDWPGDSICGKFLRHNYRRHEYSE